MTQVPAEIAFEDSLALCERLKKVVVDELLTMLKGKPPVPPEYLVMILTSVMVNVVGGACSPKPTAEVVNKLVIMFLKELEATYDTMMRNARKHEEEGERTYD